METMHSKSVDVERGKAAMNAKSKQQPVPVRAALATRTFKKVQVVYYLTRNGHLEHPHYMEVTILAHHQLRLKDVIDRLTALRGKGMLSMYSWSCKRSYKNGYVWNDLSENDVINPVDGAEYVLKGSEIIDSSRADQDQRFQPVHVNSSRQLIQDQEPRNHHSKRSMVAPIVHNNTTEVVDYSRFEDQDYEGQEEYDEEEKTSYTSSTTPQSRCSRGVATDELDEKPGSETNTKPTCEPQCPERSQTGNTSSRYRLRDVGPITLGRNSVLFQLISCGNMAKSVPNDCEAQQEVLPAAAAGGEQEAGEVEDEKERVMIRFMSENPRFGNLQSEEKEYFSGSIVEAIDRVTAEQPPVALKRSNSYNEERSSVKGIDEAGVAANELEDEKKDRAMAKAKGKCIPRMMSSAKTAKRK